MLNRKTLFLIAGETSAHPHNVFGWIIFNLAVLLTNCLLNHHCGCFDRKALLAMAADVPISHCFDEHRGVIAQQSKGRFF